MEDVNSVIDDGARVAAAMASFLPPLPPSSSYESVLGMDDFFVLQRRQEEEEVEEEEDERPQSQPDDGNGEDIVIIGGGIAIDANDNSIINNNSNSIDRPKNPRMQTFAYLNRPDVEVRVVGIVLLSCFLQAIDTLSGLPYVVHRSIDVIDTVCVYVFAIEFFLRWWSAGRFQLRYLSKPLVSIDAVSCPPPRPARSLPIPSLMHV